MIFLLGRVKPVGWLEAGALLREKILLDPRQLNKC